MLEEFGQPPHVPGNVLIQCRVKKPLQRDVDAARVLPTSPNRSALGGALLSSTPGI